MIVTLYSCSVQKTKVIPKSVTSYSPDLNKLSNSEIGMALIWKENGQKYDAIEITKEFEIKLDYISEKIEFGEVFINRLNTNKYDLYSNSSDSKFGIAIPLNGENPLIYTTSNYDGIYTNSFSESGINFIRPKERIEYIQTKVPVEEKEYYKQEFIYNGRVGDGLKFIYREYVNDYARPAFTQDVQYDLKDSNIIGFRGLRIEVLNATNTNIEYKVLSYFDK